MRTLRQVVRRPEKSKQVLLTPMHADGPGRRGVPPCRCACGTQIPARRQKCGDCLAAGKKLRRQRKKRAERARKRGVRREPYTLAEIAARDRYRCGICIAEGRSRQARIAMTKTVPHPKAPTIDHVVPLAKGGDDTRANIQLAHFGCNARKHTGGTQQLALIG
jgi:5-methylcytosine-specific restriction endonuclease McrA